MWRDFREATERLSVDFDEVLENCSFRRNKRGKIPEVGMKVWSQPQIDDCGGSPESGHHGPCCGSRILFCHQRLMRKLKRSTRLAQQKWRKFLLRCWTLQRLLDFNGWQDKFKDKLQGWFKVLNKESRECFNYWRIKWDHQKEADPLTVVHSNDSAKVMKAVKFMGVYKQTLTWSERIGLW